MPSIAEDRVLEILERAEEQKLADISEAVSIATSHNVSIPEKYSFRICRTCKSFLIPGKNSTVRIDSTKQNIVYSCGKCGEVERHGF